MTEPDIEYMNAVTANDWRLYYEPRTLATLGIWSNHGRNMMMGSDVQDWDEYDKLLETTGVALSMKEMGREDASDEIASIRYWNDASPTTLDKYVSWFSTRGNNKKKAAFKLSDCQSIPEKDDSDYQARAKDEREAKSFQGTYAKRGFSRYLDADETLAFEAALQKIADSARAEAIGEYIDATSTAMANVALDEIKSLIDKKSDTQSMPSKCGFFEYVSNRIELYRSIKHVINQLAPKQICEKQYLGELEGKGKLHLVTRKRILSTGSKTAEFRLGIKILKKWKEALEDICDSVFDADLPAHVKEFVDIDAESGIGSLEEFIGVEKYVVREGSDDRYEPSDGEKGMINAPRLRANRKAPVCKRGTLHSKTSHVPDFVFANHRIYKPWKDRVLC